MFQLDKRLQNDTFFIGNFPLSTLLLMNDSRYPWVILVPRIDALSELDQLDATETTQLWLESSQVSSVLRNEFTGDKLNIAALGNIVKQLHLHHVFRNELDPAWPGPVWGHSAAVPYSNDKFEQVLEKFKSLVFVAKG